MLYLRDRAYPLSRFWDSPSFVRIASITYLLYLSRRTHVPKSSLFFVVMLLTSILSPETNSLLKMVLTFRHATSRLSRIQSITRSLASFKNRWGLMWLKFIIASVNTRFSKDRIDLRPQEPSQVVVIGATRAKLWRRMFLTPSNRTICATRELVLPVNISFRLRRHSFSNDPRRSSYLPHEVRVILLANSSRLPSRSIETAISTVLVETFGELSMFTFYFWNVDIQRVSPRLSKNTSNSTLRQIALAQLRERRFVFFASRIFLEMSRI